MDVMPYRIAFYATHHSSDPDSAPPLGNWRVAPKVTFGKKARTSLREEYGNKPKPTKGRRLPGRAGVKGVGSARTRSKPCGHHYRERITGMRGGCSAAEEASPIAKG
jgi:hypothetical protein